MLKSFLWLIALTLMPITGVWAQQFAGDNQWVAPHGVVTLVGTVGQDYSQFYLVGAIIPNWELNIQLTHYYDDPRTNSDSYTSPSIYLKHRITQNEAETAGYAFLAGVGLFPQHLDQGEVTSSFRSWWAMGVATYAFANNTILWDILPGATVNLNHKQSGNTKWGFTYSSRLAIYKIIPQSAIVSEIFGTAGGAYSPLSYRAGIRWEHTNLIVAGTYSRAFNKSYGAGFEIGILFLTEPLFGPNRKNK
ncbi:hypothetical protein [Fulvivirga sedimenti]|uniref:Transporter n=1 Tax=Fulvivirga sedimenti TaxID=2879465 RepID=A0A9X1HSD8_9BACT|nr:hypothetical protein [Fulvivirga sedimenti]MCA6074765.1 hypothetical protein [Fulvivirga sedimenti]MCA6075942.1 hypothetical protein [Fulvivirga sedimenti]MCA6077070.1 hypothetical protein [Fulvivirga sedimenti]